MFANLFIFQFQTFCVSHTKDIGDKKLAMALDRLGSLYFSVNRYEDAERSFRESLSLHAENGNVKAHLAAVLVNIARNTEAELLLRDAVDNDVNCKYLEATKNLASLYSEFKKMS